MTCPYCNSEAKLVDSSIIYHGKSYGWAYVCANFPTCDSYVGCHRGTDKPLGRMANKELRAAKSLAHKVFDALWPKKFYRGGLTRRQIRNHGYKWLSEELGIPYSQCHIGMMDTDLCKKVVEKCGGRTDGFHGQRS